MRGLLKLAVTTSFLAAFRFQRMLCKNSMFPEKVFPLDMSVCHERTSFSM